MAFLIGITFLSACSKTSSSTANREDSLAPSEGISSSIPVSVNEQDSVKSFIYSLYYIEDEGEPFVTPATKAEFKKYGVKTSVPGLGDPISLDEIYSPYFTEDYKKNNNPRPGVAIWGGSSIDYEDPYDLRVDDVIFNEDGTAVAVIKSGESYNNGTPLSIEVYTLKKEEGKWKIAKIEQAG